jgi:hypothetical protein
MTSKSFHIGDIFSITTGCLVSPRRIGGVYDILGWMTGEDLMTHQLPRASAQCEPSLRWQHKDLAAVTYPGGTGSEAVDRWLAQQVAVFGETREVEPLAESERRHDVNPLHELAERIGPGKKIIPVVIP